MIPICFRTMIIDNMPIVSCNLELQACTFFRIGCLLQLPCAMADPVQSSMQSRQYWAQSAANWASIAATAAYNRGVGME